MKFKLLNAALAGIILSASCLVNVANAELINIDFSGVGGTLTDGTTYTLAGGYSTFGNGFRISNETLVITFSNTVNFQILSNSSDAHAWNNIADGTVDFGVTGGTLGLLADPDSEIFSTVGDGTANLEFSFRYEGSGPKGPHGDDYIAANQNWIVGGTTTSTLIITHTPNIPNTSSFEILAEGVSVPEPSTLAIFVLGMIGLASRRFKKQA